MKKILTSLCALIAVSAVAQNNGGIDAAMMEQIRTGYKGTAAELAVKKLVYLDNLKFICHTLLMHQKVVRDIILVMFNKQYKIVNPVFHVH